MQWPSLYQLAWEIGFRRGQLKAARKVLHILGDWELGPPNARIARIIARCDDLEQLEDLVMRVRAARSWPALLARLLPKNQAPAAALAVRRKVRLGRRRAMLSRLRAPRRVSRPC
jgi:hypothetical protein